MKLRIQRPHCPILLGVAGSLVFAAAVAAPAPNGTGPNGAARCRMASRRKPIRPPPGRKPPTSNGRSRFPGSGDATPIIWDNRVFIQTAVPTGKKVEPKPAEAAAEPPNQGPGGPGGPGGAKGKAGFGPGPKPTEFDQFTVLCLDRQTGKVLWQQVAREEVRTKAIARAKAASHRPRGSLMASTFTPTSARAASTAMTWTASRSGTRTWARCAW